MWKAIASTALSVFVVVLFLVAGVVTWGVNTWSKEGPLAEAICLQVESGSSMRRVSKQLDGQGAVASPWIFRSGTEYAELDDKLKAGSFLIPESASMKEIAGIITGSGQSTCGSEVVYRIGVTRLLAEARTLDPATGRYVESDEFAYDSEPMPDAIAALIEAPDTQFRLVVAEGVTSWQVREGLARTGLFGETDVDVPAEGSLAPDSYAFKPGDSAAELLASMEARQEDRLAEAWAARSDKIAVTSPEEALVLASIIEKETGVPGERGQVASVFTNRLNEGMRLQTDPTVIYGITKGEGVLGRGLRRSELDRETPYNTYVIAGLPPTPIANPGKASIEAALDPDETNLIFFVADGTGGHAFAATLDEHNRNVARWREIEAERAAQSGSGN